MLLPRIQIASRLSPPDGFETAWASTLKAALRGLALLSAVVLWGCGMGGGSLEGSLAARGGGPADAGGSTADAGPNSANSPDGGNNSADGGNNGADGGNSGADGGVPVDGSVRPPLPPLPPNATPAWQDYYRARTTGGTPVLPDFSYAGFGRGDQPIPNVQGPIFDVTQFGAVADDGQSDRAAIEAAIAAAEAQNAGVVFFPPGRFRINEVSGRTTPITISSSHVVLRGSGSGPGGSELFMRHPLVPTDPSKLWSTPSIFQFKSPQGDTPVTTVTADAARESHRVQVADASSLRPGQWIVLLRNDARGSDAFLAPHRARTDWTRINSRGVEIKEHHQIRRIEGDTLVLETPIHVDVNAQHTWTISSFGHNEGIGIEDLAFVGNWHEAFQHHRNALHDSGFSALRIVRVTHSWIRRCRFVDWTRPLQLVFSANVSAENLVLEGNPGHHAILVESSTHVLVKEIDDRVGAWHGPGVGHTSAGTVLLRVRSLGRTSPELHSVFPHATLYDNVEMGLFYGRAGGAASNAPNHLRHLVLWNYRALGQSISRYDFWGRGGFVVMPIIVGFHGNSTTFDTTKLQLLESMGQPGVPESLYEAQKALRAALPSP